MVNYRESAHCTYDIKYHLVWITKYRKPILLGKIAIRTRGPGKCSRDRFRIKPLTMYIRLNMRNLIGVLLWGRKCGNA